MIFLTTLETARAFPLAPEDEQIHGPPRLLNCINTFLCCRKKFHRWQQARRDPDSVYYSSSRIYSVAVRRYVPSGSAPSIAGDSTTGLSNDISSTRNTEQLEVAIFYCHDITPGLDYTVEARKRGPYLLDCKLLDPELVLDLTTVWKPKNNRLQIAGCVTPAELLANTRRAALIREAKEQAKATSKKKMKSQKHEDAESREQGTSQVVARVVALRVTSSTQ